MPTVEYLATIKQLHTGIAELKRQHEETLVTVNNEAIEAIEQKRIEKDQFEVQMTGAYNHMRDTMQAQLATAEQRVREYNEAMESISNKVESFGVCDCENTSPEDGKCYYCECIDVFHYFIHEQAASPTTVEKEPDEEESDKGYVYCECGCHNRDNTPDATPDKGGE